MKKLLIGLLFALIIGFGVVGYTGLNDQTNEMIDQPDGNSVIIDS